MGHVQRLGLLGSPRHEQGQQPHRQCGLGGNGMPDLEAGWELGCGGLSWLVENSPGTCRLNLSACRAREGQDEGGEPGGPLRAGWGPFYSSVGQQEPVSSGFPCGEGAPRCSADVMQVRAGDGGGGDWQGGFKTEILVLS